MKNLIVVLLGGMSGERKISFLTGKACSIALKKKGYKVLNLDAKDDLTSKLKKIKPKKIYNAQHGKYGEDGYVQSILEYLKIPYTHSGVVSSSLAMDKEISRMIFKRKKILVPKSLVIKSKQSKIFIKKKIINKLKFPIVIKPINEGSSLGVHICKNVNQLYKKYKQLSKNYNRVLLEKFIPGKEIQVAIMGNRALGAIELIPKREFYDYKAKYSIKAKTEHIMPASLTKKKYKEVLKIAKKAHLSLGC